VVTRHTTPNTTQENPYRVLLSFPEKIGSLPSRYFEGMMKIILSLRSGSGEGSITVLSKLSKHKSGRK